MQLKTSFQESGKVPARRGCTWKQTDYIWGRACASGHCVPRMRSCGEGRRDPWPFCDVQTWVARQLLIQSFNSNYFCYNFRQHGKPIMLLHLWQHFLDEIKLIFFLPSLFLKHTLKTSIMPKVFKEYHIIFGTKSYLNKCLEYKIRREWRWIFGKKDKTRFTCSAVDTFSWLQRRVLTSIFLFFVFLSLHN